MDGVRLQEVAIPAESTDADVDLHVSGRQHNGLARQQDSLVRRRDRLARQHDRLTQQRDRRRVPIRLLLVIAIGGAVGACARYGASLVWPTPPGTVPWTTLTVNAVGCAAIGVLMVTIDEVPTVHPLVRPFLGTGVLGGFTTFSTYAVDAERLLVGGQAGTALAYLGLTVTSALGAVWMAVVLGRWLASLARRRP